MPANWLAPEQKIEFLGISDFGIGDIKGREEKNC